MSGKKMYIVVSAAVFLALIYFGWKLTARSAYESAEYTVIENDGDFEVREYPDLMLASTESRFDSQGEDGSFMRLFRYISGANDGKQKIAMTTPVFMDTGDDNVAGDMGFVIPKNVTEQHVPEPTHETVEIRKRTGGRFAVIQFAGRLNSESVDSAEVKLRRWIDAKGLKCDGEIETAGYDPPWTPGPFRRNEVLIRLK